MKKQFLLFILLAVFLSACGTSATPTLTAEEDVTPDISSTPDLCSTENLPEQVVKINDLTREFDDYSALASNVPQNQLVNLIPEMQRVLREAEDQTVPACLTELKKLQLLHMNVVVQTLLAFVSSKDPNAINIGIANARELHTKYDIELARLLGLTVVVPPTRTPSSSTTGVGADTPVANAPVLILNPGPNGVNLRSAPDLNATELGKLDVQATAVALGRTADNVWILVEIPGQTGQRAWAYAQLVQVSVPIEQLPVVTP